MTYSQQYILIPSGIGPFLELLTAQWCSWESSHHLNVDASIDGKAHMWMYIWMQKMDQLIWESRWSCLAGEAGACPVGLGADWCPVKERICRWFGEIWIRRKLSLVKEGICVWSVKIWVRICCSYFVTDSGKSDLGLALCKLDCVMEEMGTPTFCLDK